MRVEKTVFISYRHTNVYHALAVSQALTARGYDVFLDYQSIDSGSFERIILGQIDARAHFVVILTPSALERCNDPNDLLRREIERAIDMKRNIVPLMFDKFEFSDVQPYLAGKLAVLPQYNGLNVPPDYFDEAIERLHTRFLNKPLDMVLHPTSPKDRHEVVRQQAAAAAVPAPTQEQISAEQYFERAYARDDSGDYAAATADLAEAIRLNPQYAAAYNNRGIARKKQGDYAGAIVDYTEAIRLDPQLAVAYTNRGVARDELGEYAAATADYTEAIRLNPQDAIAYGNRGEAQFALAHYDQALRDFEKANELEPGKNMTLAELAITHHALGNVQEARRLWRVLLGMDKRYGDVEWVREELNWAEPLVEEARKLIAGL